MRKEERYEKILAYFRKEMPNAVTELEFGSVFQLLVAVILSAQCTDKRINQVTPELFRHFPDARTMAQAEPEEIYEYIHSVSYPNAKAEHLVKMARTLTAKHDGEVPQDMNALLDLPGVGRKTANVILSVAFGKAAMAVDTHIYKVELALTKHIPEADIPNAHHWLLLHGRYVCTARKPHCEKCPLESFCPKLLEGSKLE